MRIGLYARVSTMHNQNPEVQLAELREHATRRGWEVVGEYIDRGITGARERRPGLDRLWADCRKRKVDAVLVYRYDRFARSLRQLVNALEPGFSATDLHGLSGPGIQTPKEGADTIVRLAIIGPDGPTGTFCDRAGELPW